MERKNINRLVFNLNEISSAGRNMRNKEAEILTVLVTLSQISKPSIYANYLDSTVIGCNLSQSMLNN